MLLILARRNDITASSLAERWGSREATLLTPRDLSAPGWELQLPARGPSRLVAGGRGFSSRDVSGVLTRMHAVYADELEHVAAEDRSYVASEMTAFLLAWLANLACPVFNRPTPGCLCGPNWSIEQWIQFAANLDIPVKSVRRSTDCPVLEEAGGGIPVTVVGERCIGSVDPLLAGYSRRLAAAAGVEILEARFTNAGRNGMLESVSLWPDLSLADVADAALELFEPGAPC